MILPRAFLSLNLVKAEAELPWVQSTFPIGSILLGWRSLRVILFALLHQFVNVASMDTTDLQNLLALCSHLIIIDCWHFKIVTTLRYVLCICFMVSPTWVISSGEITYLLISLWFLWLDSWRWIGLLLLNLFLTSLDLSESLRDYQVLILIARELMHASSTLSFG